MKPVKARLQKLGRNAAKGWAKRKVAKQFLSPLAAAWDQLERAMPADLREQMEEAERGVSEIAAAQVWLCGGS